MIASTHWAILVAQNHKRVVEALIDRCYPHFVPLIEQLTIVRGRHERDFKPLLGEYIPIGVTATWKSLLSIRGVAGMLLNESGTPAQVLPREMERLRAMCDLDGKLKPEPLPPEYEFQYGESVRVRSGPFVGFTAKFDGKTKRGDLSAILVLFGKETSVVFKKGDLLAV